MGPYSSPAIVIVRCHTQTEGLEFRRATCGVEIPRRKHLIDFISNSLARLSIIDRSLRRKETLSRVGIFYFGSGRKPPDVDVTTVWRERTGNQALFSRHRNSIQQIAVSGLSGSGCLRYADVAAIRRCRGWSRRW